MRSAVPKVLHPIAGRPMLGYTLEAAQALGVRDPIIVIGAGAVQVRAALPSRTRVVVQTERRGTGDAVERTRRLLSRFRGDLLVLYADAPLVRVENLRRLIQAHRTSGAAATLLTAELDEPGSYGRVVRNGDGSVHAIVEHAEATDDERAIREVNIGHACFDATRLFAALRSVRPSQVKREYYLTDVIGRLAAEQSGSVQAVQAQEASEAMGINSRKELAQAAAVMRQRILERLMAQGVTIIDPANTWIDADVVIGQDTTILPYVFIESGVRIGRRCRIGPFARLRSGVRLGDEVRVGNFTELVRSTVGRGVKMNHFSYLGDATVGAKTNIGAGTVTANYDGRRKSKTRIGAGAFIGSDTVLVAPVSVGAGAVTGAGCVVPRGRVPAKAVVVGVPARPLRKSRRA
ncbi:MAG: bifunctional N-acetylglucosamine-1-phosphate uridyltransferase/glucosamine-1-phosphate acetyltransferase [Candidatus Omnitrophica bacterium]|nr:bifunctional N-acetylglucosamine-1-phosphate uridyltransferase/glucosamine-1-phosphate acetyltransferase [Candidatus Omnitrophota bacterium]